MVLRVKICCISSVAEARMAIGFGADAIGLVGPMPSGPGVISDELIAEIVVQAGGDCDTFLLTSETSLSAIIDHHEKVNTNTIQIVDKLVKGSHAEIKTALPNVKLVQVIHVLDESSIDDALEASETADLILLDSGNPGLDVKELGGTGRTHNWRISRRIVEQSKKPVYLAGGLNPENVRQAVDTAGPYGLDICSGVRTNGLLDHFKLDNFFKKLSTN